MRPTLYRVGRLFLCSGGGLGHRPHILVGRGDIALRRLQRAVAIHIAQLVASSTCKRHTPTWPWAAKPNACPAPTAPLRSSSTALSPAAHCAPCATATPPAYRSAQGVPPKSPPPRRVGRTPAANPAATPSPCWCGVGLLTVERLRLHQGRAATSSGMKWMGHISASQTASRVPGQTSR